MLMNQSVPAKRSRVAQIVTHGSPGRLIKDQLQPAITLTDLQAVAIVERNRPPPLREYDQIPMRGADLVRQMRLIAPYLAGKKIAFVGDNDGSAALLGLL